MHVTWHSASFNHWPHSKSTVYWYAHPSSSEWPGWSSSSCFVAESSVSTACLSASWALTSCSCSTPSYRDAVWVHQMDNLCPRTSYLSCLGSSCFSLAQSREKIKRFHFLFRSWFPVLGFLSDCFVRIIHSDCRSSIGCCQWRKTNGQIHSWLGSGLAKVHPLTRCLGGGTASAYLRSSSGYDGKCPDFSSYE